MYQLVGELIGQLGYKLSNIHSQIPRSQAGTASLFVNALIGIAFAYGVYEWYKTERSKARIKSL